ncbi:MAG TPA: UDP-N-acetylmuramoyl-tripeptide--D-alanyl-D-alanine ligase [Gemmatimonadaceae bacterium]|nr:UDP-N-acetylmuramoyl-tripeptide--D-alanyl-D-alanine ligase [Gemmatimonadaceae bacterium]
MSAAGPSAAPRQEATTFWAGARVAEALRERGRSFPHTDLVFTGIATDTRAIPPGSLFVALKGERFDAHEFLADAVAKGAAGLVVSRADIATPPGVPVFVVDDTLQALGDLARFRRRAWGGRVIGVLGANGKTSTKELLRAALGEKLQVHATEGNFNNLVGVPLTLFALPDRADVAVIEMGTNTPGEIARLRAIVEPDISVITSIAEEHLEGFGDIAGVLEEELAGVVGVKTAVVPASQPEVGEGARDKAAHVVSAGIEEGDLHATRWGVEPDGLGWLEVEGVEVRPPARGVHNLRNAMLALAVARELAIPMADAARGIAGMRVPPMRVNWEQLGAATLINDAYNANPGSVRAALELLAQAGKGRQRVAVLGSMLELGTHADRLHREVAETALQHGIEIVAGVGDMARALEKIGPADGRTITAPDVEALWAALAPRLSPDAVILLKGSRGARLERLVAPITAWAAAGGAGDATGAGPSLSSPAAPSSH